MTKTRRLQELRTALLELEAALGSEEGTKGTLTPNDVDVDVGPRLEE
jgi:hypothetical protein